MKWVDVLLGKEEGTVTTIETGSSTPLILFGGFILITIVAVVFITIKKG